LKRLWRYCSHGFVPTIYVKHRQTMAKAFHTRQNRNPGQIQQYTYIYMGIRLYNKVPNNIQKVEEYKPYKRKLKAFLTEHAFYSLDEFLMS
jgi:hypothetical protein